MIIKELYRVESEESVIISTEIIPGSEYSTMKRLIAGHGCVLKHPDYEGSYKIIDVQTEEGWIEEEDLSPNGDLYTEFLEGKGIPAA